MEGSNLNLIGGAEKNIKRRKEEEFKTDVTKADSEVKHAETEITEADMDVTALSENVGSTTVYRCLQL